MKTKQKILYIHGGGDTIGGIETYLAHSIKFHKKYDAYIGIIRKGLFWEYLCEQNSLENLIDFKGGKIKELFKTMCAIKNAVKYIKKNKIDIVIAHGNHSWFYAGMIKKLTGIKSILYIHGPKPKKGFIYRFGSLFRPSIYIVNSKYSLESWKYITKSNYFINYPGVNHEIVPKDEPSLLRQRLLKAYNLPNDIFIFLLSGRIQHWKGQDLAIQAFKSMKNKAKCCLLIVGDHTFSSDKPFFEYCKTLSEGEKIIYTGFQKNIFDIVLASNVIINCSREPEPFGLVIIDGMLCQKPTISTNYGGPSEIIEHNKNGLLLDPKNTDLFSKNMDLLYENADMCAQMGSNGYQKALNNFTTKISISKLEEFLQEKLEIETNQSELWLAIYG